MIVDHLVTRGHRYLYAGSMASLMAGIWTGDLRIALTGVVLLAFGAILHTSREW